MNMLIGVIAGIGVVVYFFLIIVALNAWAMYKDPDLHLWPSITRCQLCGKRIFAWQRYGRRPMSVELHNPHNIPTFVSGSCLCHKRCKGNPATNITVKRVN